MTWPLTVAIILLKRGQRLPLDLETELMGDGVIIPALKRKYEL